jgi:hypothetical protein
MWGAQVGEGIVHVLISACAHYPCVVKEDACGSVTIMHSLSHKNNLLSAGKG